ncbi:hypothetical protein AAFF_G00295650 [Aldrovandia affinis]|uniref:Uncharacterized protein n=1 Tax=Aldrovandia affinis TaxID=143900 RepID=A0AAD7WSE8_9TELE|nr:hypothetical protein AAFF_G00295650 [Aldrovandia affinis]
MSALRVDGVEMRLFTMPGRAQGLREEHGSNHPPGWFCNPSPRSSERGHEQTLRFPDNPAAALFCIADTLKCRWTVGVTPIVVTFSRLAVALPGCELGYAKETPVTVL